MPRCLRCRSSYPDDETECPFCRKHLPELLDQDALEQQRRHTIRDGTSGDGTSTQPVEYAGFIKRLIAAIPDVLIALGAGTLIDIVLNSTVYPHQGVEIILLSGALFYVLMSAVLISSRFQASFGKILAGIIVTDSFGRKLPFLRALLRECEKYLSLLFLGIGFWMIGCTTKKQGLHDLLTQTVVTDRDIPFIGKSPGQSDLQFVKKRLRLGALLFILVLAGSAIPFVYFTMITHQAVTPVGLAAHGMATAGDTLADSQYPEYSLPAYDTAIMLQPNNTAILMKRLYVLGNTGRVEEAKAYLDQMVVMYPNETTPVIYKGDLFLRDRKYNEAVLCYEQAITKDPKNAKIWVRKGDAYLVQATTEMMKIRDRYRNLTSAKYSSSTEGVVPIDEFKSTQPYQEAMKAYNKAIELDPMTSIAITGRILSSTQNLLDTYEGILDDIGGRNT